MAVMTYKCPNCGGPLKFDPAEQNFTCEYCDSDFRKEQLDDILAEEPEKSADGVVYTCPSCGAEIVTDATTAATYCYYCHNPVVLSGRLDNAFRPDFVLPFDIPKEQARKSFIGWASKKRFVPKDFYSEKSIENITGMYYPYWIADYETDASFDGKGQNSTSAIVGDYRVTTTRHYHVMRKGRLHFSNIVRGALKKADKKLSDGVHPYDLSKLLPFDMPYLSGFFAEKRDIGSEEIKGSVEEEIKSYAKPLLTADAKYSLLTGVTDSTVVSSSYKYALLPAWVLTYRGGDGTDYFYSMNAQNAKTCGKLPVSWSRLLTFCAVGGAIIFALLLAGGWFIW